MLKILLFLFLTLSACATMNSQKQTNCKACDIETVVITDKNIETLNPDQANLFLCSMKKECSTNVEFTEYSNEVLFKLIDHRTQLFIDAFANVQPKEREYLLEAIANSILDYDRKELILKVEKAEGSSGLKTALLNALRKAEK